MVENPPFNTGHISSIPTRGTKIPHAKEQLRPRAIAKMQFSQKKKSFVDGHAIKSIYFKG